MSARGKSLRSNSQEDRSLSRFDRGSIEIFSNFGLLNGPMNISIQMLFFALLELFSLNLSNDDKNEAEILFKLQLIILQFTHVLPSTMIKSAETIRESEAFHNYVKILQENTKTAMKIIENQKQSSDKTIDVAHFLKNRFPSNVVSKEKRNSIRIDFPQSDFRLRVPVPLNQNRKLMMESFNNIVVHRYIQDFDEIKKLGKGAFGSVVMAKNRLDNHSYAIKKIVFNENTDRTRRHAQLALQEVRILASLIHPNIVQYHCAWLELVPSKHRFQRNFSSKTSEKSKKTSNQLDSLDKIIEFRNSSQSSITNENESVNQQSIEKDSNQSSLAEDDDDDLSEFSGIDENEKRSQFEDSSPISSQFESKSSNNNPIIESGPSFDKKTSNDPANQQLVPMNYRNEILNRSQQNNYLDAKIVLFIQMQICDMTLYDWLRHRDQEINDEIREYSKFVNLLNESRQKQNWQIFKQILDAVQYLHSQSFVHRDIKPKNIFLCRDRQDPNIVRVKLGDFGLATLSETESTTDGTKEYIQESSAVGTALYAAPEQLNSTRCFVTDKSDSYSLGIVLFELFNVYRTEMERIVCLSDLRTQQNVDQQFSEKYSFEGKIIDKFISIEPFKRPSVSEILNVHGQDIQRKIQKFSIVNKKFVIQQLKEELRDKDEQIRQLEIELKKTNR